MLEEVIHNKKLKLKNVCNVRIGLQRQKLNPVGSI